MIAPFAYLLAFSLSVGHAEESVMESVGELGACVLPLDSPSDDHGLWRLSARVFPGNGPEWSVRLVRRTKDVFVEAFVIAGGTLEEHLARGLRGKTCEEASKRIRVVSCTTTSLQVPALLRLAKEVETMPLKVLPKTGLAFDAPLYYIKVSGAVDTAEWRIIDATESGRVRDRSPLLKLVDAIRGSVSCGPAPSSQPR